jgi:REP element-mobilizing transposase RayT
MDKPRNFYKTTFHHLYNRGAFQQNIFFEKNDYEYFHRKLIEYKERYSIKIFSYCLMPNHFHLFVKQTLDDQAISKFISSLANSYTKGINNKYKRTGILFAGKTKSKHIEDDSYFKWVVKYILENPVKAKIVKRYDEYEFSSAKELLDLKVGPVTDIKSLLSYFDSIDSFKNFMLDEKQKSDYGI